MTGSGYTAPVAPLSPHERGTSVKIVGAKMGEQLPPRGADSPVGGLPSPRDSRSSSPPGDADAEDDAAIATAPALEDGPPPGIDEAAESAFLSEARERGEAVPRRSAAEMEEEAAPKTLPPLDELVKKIPAEVRDVLEDLFRARFVTVKRFPKKALKPEK